MRSSRHVNQLFLLPRLVSTAGSSEIAKGSVVPFFFPSPLLHARLSLLFFLFFLIFFPFFLFLLSFLFFFSFPFSFLLPFLFFSFPTGLFGLLQVRGSFLSLYYSSCHMSLFHGPCVTWTHVLGGTLHTTWLSCHVSFSHGAIWQPLVMPYGTTPCVALHPVP